MLPVSVLIICALVVCCCIYWLLSNRRRHDDDGQALPGPWGLPFIGYLPWIDPRAPYETFARLAERYGSVYSLKLGRLEAVFISDPNLIRQAFNLQIFSGRAPLYLTHGIMKGYGLICAEGEMWRQHRRFVVHLMKQLGMAGSLMEARIMDRMMDYVNELQEAGKDGQAVDFVPGLRHCIGNVINGVVFGRTYAADDPTWIWLQHLLDEGIKQVAVAGPLNFLPILRFLPNFKRTMKFILDGQSETHRHYQEIIDAHQPLPLDDDHVADIIDGYLLEMQRQSTSCTATTTFTMVQLHHVLADLFGAGTDTALSTIKWIFLYMVLYPDIQSRVQEEIDRVIGAERAPCHDSDAGRMPLTEAVICEVQRLNTILPLGVPHGALQDCQLGGFRIRKGAMIVPLHWVMNRDAKLWAPDPLQFRPDRFLPPNNKRPDHFMPFQSGKRSCIGEQLGRQILFLSTTTILQRFRLQFPPSFHYNSVQMKPEYGFTLIPPPFKLCLIPRS